MPHLVITLPLVITLILYLWTQKLLNHRETLLNEQNNLKPQIQAQEILLRETIDPALYETFRNLFIKEKKEQLEDLRMNEQGCTDKCRVKNSALETDLQRNKALVEKLTKFEWCDLCNSGNVNQKGKSPPSGDVKGLPVCKYGCGMRFVQQCKPVMVNYQKSDARIK